MLIINILHQINGSRGLCNFLNKKPFLYNVLCNFERTAVEKYIKGVLARRSQEAQPNSKLLCPYILDKHTVMKLTRSFYRITI